MNRITAREKVVNDGEVETQFTGKNLTSVGGIKLFHKFARKLGVEKALEQSIKLPRRRSSIRQAEYCSRSYIPSFGHRSSPGR